MSRRSQGNCVEEDSLLYPMRSSSTSRMRRTVEYCLPNVDSSGPSIAIHQNASHDYQPLATVENKSLGLCINIEEFGISLAEIDTAIANSRIQKDYFKKFMQRTSSAGVIRGINFYICLKQ